MAVPDLPSTIPAISPTTDVDLLHPPVLCPDDPHASGESVMHGEGWGTEPSASFSSRAKVWRQT
jgi:hypothetical protein